MTSPVDGLKTQLKQTLQVFEFMKAMESEDWSAALPLLQNNPGMVRDVQHPYWLIQAAQAGQARMVQILLDQGANPAHQDGEACYHAPQRNHAEVVRILLPVSPVEWFGYGKALADVLTSVSDAEAVLPLAAAQLNRQRAAEVIWGQVGRQDGPSPAEAGRASDRLAPYATPEEVDRWLARCGATHVPVLAARARAHHRQQDLDRRAPGLGASRRSRI